MPGMDGQQLHRLLSEHDPMLAKKMVFITGDTAGEATQTFLKSTGNPVLSKPFGIAAIRQLIEPFTKRAVSTARN